MREFQKKEAGGGRYEGREDQTLYPLFKWAFLP